MVSTDDEIIAQLSTVPARSGPPNRALAIDPIVYVRLRCPSWNASYYITERARDDPLLASGYYLDARGRLSYLPMFIVTDAVPSASAHFQPLLEYDSSWIPRAAFDIPEIARAWSARTGRVR